MKINSITFGFCAIIFLLCGDTAFAETPRIENPSGCASKIGNGGNYYSVATGRLSGKCQGSGLTPSLNGDVIVFSAPSTESQLIKLSKNTNDRSELAFSRNLIQYNKDYIFDFKVQVDPNSSVTDNFFYLMQIWQSPEYSPIFGLRIDRGTQAVGAFVIRNKENHIAGKRLVRVEMSSKLKNYRIYMNFGKNLNSHIRIYEDSRLISDWSGDVGYLSEKSGNRNNSLILKFGLYKGPEPSKNFKIYFKDVTLTEES
ncbi:hypothetical protein EC844_10580 [Acinetobacter calcoaceticus]|uniref:Polysaccharide lyase-like protein n=1 Tax=Acinetobacter calcoaceticus TaxID=471 RepID=A0A4R1XV19_ACICA|nr:hypothetical protein EC844_10580 [Acinetobacter calcoaceticus]